MTPGKPLGCSGFFRTALVLRRLDLQRIMGIKTEKMSHTSQPENKQQAAIFLGPCRADHARTGSGF